MTLLTKKRNGEFPSLFSDWPTTSSLFNPMFRDLETMLLPNRIGVTLPSANVKERENDFMVELAAPGFDRKDFKIELEDNVLTIMAEKEEEKEEEENNFSRREFAYNSFSRIFRLPENTKDDKVDAKYANGILTILIPKKEVKPHKTKKQISVS